MNASTFYLRLLVTFCLPTLRPIAIGQAQGPVTKKGTTNANRLIGLVAQGYSPGPTNLTVRTVRGQAARRLIEKFSSGRICSCEESIKPD